MKTHILTLLMAVLFALPVYAADLAPQGPFRALDDNGDPCSGCKLHTYSAGTTTNKTTYNDASEATANANPVILNSSGYADVWLDDGAYKFVLKDENDATIWTIDDIAGSAASSFGDTVATINTNTSITSAYENNLIITTSSPTLSLDSASTLGQGFTFAVKNNDSGTATLNPDGSETIDGNSSFTLSGTGAYAQLFSDGTNWISTSLGADTGDIEMTLRGTPKGGWIFLNGETIGDTGSGADKTGASYESLYEFLWTNLANTEAAVSTGRGASAAADWAAGKTLTLPDFQDRAPFGVGTTWARVGQTQGSETIAQSQLPNVTLSITGSTSTDGAHTHSFTVYDSTLGGTAPKQSVAAGGTVSYNTNSAGSHSHTLTGNTEAMGSGNDFLPKGFGVNWMIKL